MIPRYTGPQFDPHVAWTKVKSSAMKRPHLDCGCRNDGVTDTYLHYGCPRISCKQHAEDPHECDHYEPQAPPREESPDVAAVDAVLRNVAAVDPLIELPPLIADPRVQSTAEFVANAAAWYRVLDQRDAQRESLGEWPPDPEPHADVRVMTPDEAARFDAHQRLSLECSRSRPMCNGCDGGAMDGFTCMHECHREPDAAPVDPLTEPYAGVCFLCSWRTRGDAEEVRRATRAHICAEHPYREPAAQSEPDAPHLDAALQPVLDVPSRRPWWWVW